MFNNQSLGFIGGGNMGEALMRGLISASLIPAEKVCVFDVVEARVKYLENELSIRTCRDIAELAQTSSIILIAVKPQTITTVLDTLSSHLSHKPLVISIAAGIALNVLEQRLPQDSAVVRVMPNAPALVAQAASALSRGKAVTDKQMQMCLTLFATVGKAVEIEEKLMDAVTGLSGSGPAYVLLMIEAMIDAGVLMGLPRQAARDLVIQTVVGTSRLLEATGKHPAELRDVITSPGGTTIHGLQVLESYSVRAAFLECVEAATNRSTELGKH
ncbi:MAG: pyrroline-5-carboxylate reductase [Syntrophobacteraceae bacterium]